MSVSGRRTIYRERSVEREHDEQPRRTYTTVRRYQVPESISRTIYKDEQEDEHQDKVIIKRTTREDPPPSSPSRHSHKSRRDDDVEYRFTESRYENDRPQEEREVDTYRFTRTERSADPPRRDISYRVLERDSDYERPRSEYRVVERDTEVTRAPSPPSPERVREFRFERDRDFSPARERPYDVERYSKSTEYFTQPQPQPIIIRESAPQAPIIIREERREPQRIIIRREEPRFEFIERKEVEETRDESRSLVKSEAPPPAPEPSPEPEPQPQPQKQPEEDYFYERRVVERRRRSDSYDRRPEKEIRPRDSASNYSSDDSYEYIRRERTYDDDDKDHHHKRHIAEGAIAGIGAAEIIRNHRKRRGEQTGGRGRSALGGAAVGAIGAEALSRVRSMRSLRRGSESRSRSGERRHRRKHRSRSRSRSKSWTRGQQLGGLAAVAAVGALAGYALKNRGNKETVIVNGGSGRHHRRSRSRRRRASVDGYASEDGQRPLSEHRDPEHRNRRIAQAGLASAAAAGIWEKVRSRSRGGKARSKSRVRQGVPIAAAGLGGAALAGLYEKNKANKEAKKDAIIEDELNRGRRRHSRSRSRSRSVPASHIGGDRRDVDGAGLIAYGDEPIYPEDRHGRHSDEEPGRYRRRGGSAESSPDTRRHHGSRSRSRGRNLAEIGAAAGAAGIAAHELGKRRERSRAARERSREGAPDPYFDNAHPPEQPYSPPPVGNSGYIQGQQQHPSYDQQQAYPSSNYFPPPPTGDAAAHDNAYAHQTAYPAYNPADYANQPAQQYPYDTTHGAYGDSDANLGYPQPNDTYAGDTRYGEQDHERGRGRPDPENMV